MEEFKYVINNGRDIDMHGLFGCDMHTLDECEKSCRKYYDCNKVAEANDILKEYENSR